MARLSLFLMGQMVVTLDNQPATGFESGKVRALLAYLGIEFGRTHSREALASLLWPDQPEQTARNNLRQALANLRQAIGDNTASPPFLLITRETVQFNPSSDHWIDAAAFNALIDAHQKHSHRHPETCLVCSRWLAHAAELYRGNFLDTFYVSDSAPFEEWSLVKREKLLHLSLNMFFHLAVGCERRKDFEQAYQYASRQLELDPWREEAYQQAMRIQAFQGQRNAALALYEHCRRTLEAELGVEPTSETQALYEQIRSGRLTSIRRPGQDLTVTLPDPGTSFINRNKELEEVEALLENPACRLITLMGPGGIGKTRLVLRIAQQVKHSFRDGVYYIPLSGLSSGEFLISALAAALSLTFSGKKTSQEQLFDYLRSKDLLLILDSFEHLLEATPLLAQILQQTSGVVILVTSRQRLALQAEWLYDLEGLDYPVETVDRDPLNYSAVALFVERARQVRRRFTLKPDDTIPVVQICQIVEGLPLGLELAAAAVRWRTCREIAGELSANLLTLQSSLRDTPERQSSLWAAFEYSWRLLSDGERRIFPLLSVFRGGFQSGAAIQVTGATSELLSSLVDQSFLRREEARGRTKRLLGGCVRAAYAARTQPPFTTTFECSQARNRPDSNTTVAERYDMNALLRQYALVKLSEQGGLAAVRDQHLAYFLSLAEEAEPHLLSGDEEGWLKRLEIDHDNLRAALAWALESHDSASAGRLGSALGRFWGLRGYLGEGRRWMELILNLFSASTDPGNLRIQAKVLLEAGALAWRQGDLEQARALMEATVTISQQNGNREELSRALHSLATVVSTQGDDGHAAALLGECFALDQELDNLQGMAFDLGTLGDIAYQHGDYPKAQVYYEESLALHRKREDQHSIAICLNNLGEVLRLRGDDAQSTACIEEAISLFRLLGIRQSLALALVNLGDLKRMANQSDKAVVLYCEALTLQNDLGVKGDMVTTIMAFASMALENSLFERATRLFAAAEVLRKSVNVPLTPAQDAEKTTALETLRLRLGEPFFDSNWDMGCRMKLEQVVSLAFV